MDRATIEALASNVETDAEAEALARLIVREGKKPEVLVTMQWGGGKRQRYVVEHEDRDKILALREAFEADPEETRDRHWGLYVGGRWLRAYGKVDEMYRALSFHEVVKIELADSRRVWGDTP